MSKARCVRLLPFVLCLLLGATTAVWAAGPQSISGESPPADSQQKDRPVGDKWALIVGISKYADQSINLKYPAKDAQDFHDFLVKEGGFAPDHVRLLTDEKATRARILDELGDRWLPRVAGPNDVVVIYISSHGSASDLDIGGINYLVAHDTNKARLYSTGIAMQDLCRIIKSRVHSDRALIILDACHSGAVTPDSKGLYRQGNVSAEEVALGTGQLVLTSSQPQQVSWESKADANSVFTRHLINGLKSKGKDTCLSDAYQFLKDKVQEEVQRERGVMQIPVLKGKWEGSDLMLAVAPANPHPGLPDEPEPDGAAQPPSESKQVVAVAAPAAAAPPAVAKPEPPEGIAVMQFTGPAQVESDASLGFSLRSGGAHIPDAGDFANLPDALQRCIREKLSALTKEKVIGPAEVSAALSKSEAQPAGPYWKQTGQAAGVKYVITGTIGDVIFEGNTISGDRYIVTVSARLIATESGQTIWRVNDKRFEKKMWAGKKMEPIDGFYQVLVPQIAGFLASRAASAMESSDGAAGSK